MITEALTKLLFDFAAFTGIKKIQDKFKMTSQKALYRAVNEAIDEYKKKHFNRNDNGKFPFYESEPFLLEMLKYRFSGNDDKLFDPDRLHEILEQNDNIIPPYKEELQDYFEILERNIKSNDELKSLEIEENYKEEIFKISVEFHKLLPDFYTMKEQIRDIHDVVIKGNTPDKIIPKEINKISRRKEREIIGRKKALSDLREGLVRDKKILLLNGMGGIGKTTLAEVYTDTYYEEYKHIIWIRNEESFENAFLADAQIINNLGLGIYEKEVILPIGMNMLCNLKGPNLMVIDNGTRELAKYYDSLPKPPEWHLLVTSREKIECLEIMELDFLTEEEAKELFIKYCDKFTDDEVLNLIGKVEYHTLTIELIAKGATKNRWSYEKARKALNEDAKINVATARSGYDKIDRIKSYISGLFNANNKDDKEKWILKQFLALPTEEIEYDFLTRLIKIDLLDWEEEFPDKLDELHETGFLLNNKINDSYKMHPIIREALLNDLKPEYNETENLIDSVSELLNYDQAKDNPIDKFQYIPYGERLLELFLVDKEKELSDLMNNLASVYQALGKYETAAELLEKALTSNKRNYGEDHPTVAVSQSNLALVYQDLGKYETAAELLEKALASAIRNYGEAHPRVAVRQSNLALVYQDLGKYEPAAELLEKALASDMQNYGEAHPTVAARQSNLALVYKDLGKYEPAVGLLEKALASNMRNYGENHPSVAISQSNLATVYLALGKYEPAVELLEEALRIMNSTVGKEHPNTVIIRKNLEYIKKIIAERGK